MPHQRKPSILVSACLAGCSTNLCGRHSVDRKIENWVKEGRAVAVCPEQLGGLETPRLPAEISGQGGEAVLMGRSKVVRSDGVDVTEAFQAGALRTVRIAQSLQPDVIVLKERSPSCGVHQIYDGTFRGQRLNDQMGVTAAALVSCGFRVINEEEVQDL